MKKPDPIRPKLLDEEAWRALSPAHRKPYNQPRIDFTSGLPIVLLPRFAEVHSHLWSLVKGNKDHPPGARAAGVISGHPLLGKSTMATRFGREYELELRAEHGWERTVAGELFIPVVYITLSDDTTVKSFNAAIADFYGIPTNYATKDDLTRTIKRHAYRCGTSLLIVDDIHFLVDAKEGKKVNAHMKTLQNVIAATFIIVGVAVEQTGLLDDGKKLGAVEFAQTRARYSVREVERFESAKDPAFLGLLRTLDRRLPLHGAHEGMLCRRLAPYIYRRTSGVLGSVMELTRRGAIAAIERAGTRPGTYETLTKALLHGIRIDHAAETQYRRQYPDEAKWKPTKDEELVKKEQTKAGTAA